MVRAVAKRSFPVFIDVVAGENADHAAGPDCLDGPAQIDPIAVSLGPLKIHWYGLMYLLGFAATTGSVADWVFDSVADTLILDADMLERLRENNPYATSRIGELLIESNSRGYWQTSPERLQQVRDIVPHCPVAFKTEGKKGVLVKGE